MPSKVDFNDSTIARVLLQPFKLGFAMTIGLAGLLLLAWTLAWIHVAHVWSGRTEGLRHLLMTEMAVGAEFVARQGSSALPPSAFANGLYGGVFEATGLHNMGLRFADGDSLSVPDTVLRRAWIAHHEEVEIAMLSTQLVGIRAGVFLRFLPLFLLLYAVGTFEGLCQRAVRRAQAARESANIYHRAKYTQVVILGMGLVCALVLPMPVSWSHWMGAGAVVVGSLAACQWAYYKKHL